MILGLVACAAPPTETQLAPQTTDAIETVEVETRRIVDSIGFDATASSGLDYAVTAPSQGTLSLEASNEGALPGGDFTTLAPQGVRFWFTPAEGTPTELSIPSSAREVELLAPLEGGVPQDTPVLRVRDAAILLRAHPSPEQVMRMGMRVPLRVRAQVAGSAGPSDCAPTDSRFGTDSDGFTFTCRLPPNVPLVVGAEAKVVVVLDEKDAVPALPVEAIAGTLDAGSVFLADAPDTEHSVELGVTDGAFVEVTEGLAVGDRVVLPSPSLLERAGE